MLAGTHPRRRTIGAIVEAPGYHARLLDYLRRYRREVTRLRSVRIPYAAMQLLSRWAESYHRRSRGQLPAVFTRYKTATLWKGTGFDNSKLKALGWTPRVGTEEGLARSFAAFRAAAKG